MFAILYFSSMIIGISMMKITGIMVEVTEYLNITPSQAGLLVSIFTLSGVVLVIPGASIMRRTGPKNLLIALMIMLAAGNVLGALTMNFTIMLLSRILEGVSYALILMLGIELINIWYNEKGVATMTGVYNSFFPVAAFLAMNASLPIYRSFGLKGVWWILAALSLLSAVLVAIFIQVPERTQQEDEAEQGLKEAASNVKVWVLAITMGCLMFVLFGLLTCYPQLFTEYYQVSPERANYLTGLNGLFGIPACIFSGILIERTGKPFWAAVIGSIGTMALAWTITALSAGTYVTHVAASAIMPGGLASTAIFILIPMLATNAKLIGYSLSFGNAMYYLGVLLSTPLIVSFAQSSWMDVRLLLTAAALAAVVLLVVFFRKELMAEIKSSS